MPHSSDDDASDSASDDDDVVRRRAAEGVLQLRTHNGSQSMPSKSSYSNIGNDDFDDDDSYGDLVEKDSLPQSYSDEGSAPIPIPSSSFRNDMQSTSLNPDFISNVWSDGEEDMSDPGDEEGVYSELDLDKDDVAGFDNRIAAAIAARVLVPRTLGNNLQPSLKSDRVDHGNGTDIARSTVRSTRYIDCDGDVSDDGNALALFDQELTVGEQERHHRVLQELELHGFASRARNKRKIDDRKRNRLEASMDLDEYDDGRRNKKRTRRRKSDIPMHMQSRMGNVNTLYAMGRYEDALTECLSLIEDGNMNHDGPYMTLATIYKELGDTVGEHHALLKAADIAKVDYERWFRVGEFHSHSDIADDNLLAKMCLSKAIRCAPSNSVEYSVSLALRAKMNMKLGKYSSCIRDTTEYVKSNQVTVDIAKDFALACHLLNAKAHDSMGITMLQTALRNSYERKEDIDLGALNILVELLMTSERQAWAEALSEIRQAELYLGLSSSLPLDLIGKLGICKARSSSVSDASPHFDLLLKDEVRNANVYGDLFLDIGIVCMECNDVEFALRFFEPLVKYNRAYNQPRVWLYMGDCYLKKSQSMSHNLSVKKHCLDSAANYLERVLKEQSDSKVARMTLSSVYTAMDLPEQALDVLKEIRYEEDVSDAFGSDMMECETNVSGSGDTPQETIVRPLTVNKENIDARMQTALCALDANQYQEFMTIMEPMVRADLAGAAMFYRRKRANKLLLSLENKKRGRPTLQTQKNNTLVAYRKQVDTVGNVACRYTPENLNLENYCGAAVAASSTLRNFESGNPYLAIVKTIVIILVREDRTEDARWLLDDALMSKKFTNIRDGSYDTVRHLAAIVSLRLNDIERGGKHMRKICANHPYNITLWNRFNKISNSSGQLEWSRNRSFLVRKLRLHVDSLPLMIVVGHCCTVTERHRLALGEYYRAYRALPDHPMINLCVGLSFLHLVMQKTTANRHATVVQAFAFIYQYHRLRQSAYGEEADYNLGRAYQSLGINHLAINYYEKVLTHDYRLTCATSKNCTSRRDMKYHAAFNLSLIYKESGAVALARQIMTMYLTI